jgi:hypothetical protein
MKKYLLLLFIFSTGVFVYAQERTYIFESLGAIYTIMDLGITTNNLSSAEIAARTRSIIEESPYRWRLEEPSAMAMAVSIISSRYQTDGRLYLAIIEFPSIYQVNIGIIYYPRNSNPVYTFYSRPR